MSACCVLPDKMAAAGRLRHMPLLMAILSYLCFAWRPVHLSMCTPYKAADRLAGTVLIHFQSQHTYLLKSLACLCILP